LKSIQRTRKVLIGARWFLITGLVFYSLMTTTPFVSEHSEWAWSGFALGLIVDAAFIMSLQADSTLAMLGVRLSGWPVAFRWFTGLASVFLNVWVSVAHNDWVGVAVHVIAPALVMLLAEVGPVYLAALAEAERAAENDAFAQQVTNEVPLTDWERELPQDAAETRRAALTRNATLDAMLKADIEFAESIAEVPQAKLSRSEANAIIEQGWRHKLPVAEVATAASRHPSTVRRKYSELEAALVA
jgi:hypothetical protein